MENSKDIPAVAVARAIYRRNGENFKADLNEHLRHGYVLALPHVFVMARVVKFEDGRVAWFVKMAVGELKTLLGFMPVRMPYVAFRRSKNRRLRVYRTEELMKRARLRPAERDYGVVRPGVPPGEERMAA